MDSDSMKLSCLPCWDLAQHFPWTSWNDPKITTAIEQIEQDAASFDERFRGEIKRKLEPSLLAYSDLVTKITEVLTFLKLIYDEDQSNEEMFQFKTQVEARLNKCQADHLVFYPLELGDYPKHLVDAAEPSSVTAKFSSFIKEQYRYRPHQLDVSIERALTVREPWASPYPVVEYYVKQLTSSTFLIDQKTLTLEEILSLLMHPSAERRHTALKALNQGLHDQYIDRFAALSLNVVSGSWYIESQERKYPTLRARRHLSNDVSESVVNALLTAVRTTGVDLSKRYYRFKKQLLSRLTETKGFTWADRNAPLPLPSASKKYTWDEAVKICDAAFQNCSPTMHQLFQQQVCEKRIHAAPTPHKMTGAYCCHITPTIGPFQLQTFMGEINDVSTLAHESGHAIHFRLSSEQGVLQNDPPLTLAETASTFGEILVFYAMLHSIESKEEQLMMILQRIDNIVNCVVRQCSFDRFEELVFTERQRGVIPDAQFPVFWLQAVKEYYGKPLSEDRENGIFDHYDNIDNLWAYVTHFHQTPFYVYSYAFAELVTGALYSVYKSGAPTFEANLLNLLKAGSTKTFVEVLKPFGLDPEQPHFWKASLVDNLGSLIAEAETLAKKLKCI